MANSDKLIGLLKAKIVHHDSNFIPQEEYDSGFNQFSNWVRELLPVYVAHLEIRHPSLRKHSKPDEYALHCFTVYNSGRYADRQYRFESSEPLDIGTIEREYPDKVSELKKKYEQLVERRSHEVIKSFSEFVGESNGGQRTPLVKKFQTEYSYSYFRDQNTREDVDHCLSRINESTMQEQSDYWKLVSGITNDIQKEKTSPFDEYFVNVGKRDFSRSGYRLVNTFHIKEGEKEYTFTNNNDTETITGFFANVFVLSKAGLLKLSFVPERRVERILYSFRDIQRVVLKDDRVVKVQMHKHYDGEVIVCDTEDMAFKLQEKIEELKRTAFTHRNQR
jgi:hypothetical protein